MDGPVKCGLRRKEKEKTQEFRQGLGRAEDEEGERLCQVGLKGNITTQMTSRKSAGHCRKGTTGQTTGNGQDGRTDGWFLFFFFSIFL